MATISVCMMVKDGGKLFEQAVRSVLDVADELIVVNTDDDQTTDDTIFLQGLKDAGGRVTVLHRPWERNFSKHRMQSIEPAQGDWILYIDADEKMELGNGMTPESLKALLDKQPKGVNAIAITLRDIQKGMEVMRSNQARIFRNGHLSFERRVHNRPVYDGEARSCADISFYHYGYDLSPEKMAAKFERTSTLLMEELEANPNDSRNLFYLCQLHVAYERLEEGLAWGRKYLDATMRQGKEFDMTAVHTVCRTLLRMEKVEEALEVVQGGLVIEDCNPNLSAILSDIGVAMKNTRLIAEGARRYLDGLAQLQKEPWKSGGQAIFSARPEVFNLMLGRLFLVSMEEAMMAWNAMKGRFLDIPEDIQQGIRSELKKNKLDVLLEGVPSGVHYVQPANPGPLEVLR